MRDPLDKASSTRVLLVEDSEINRDLLRRRLLRRGFFVEVAADGRAGYEKALELVPDVVLMDMSLPEMDGWEATTRLREDAFTQPIIGLTAHALSEDRIRALDAGCNDFITKPVDFDHLVESILRLAAQPPVPLAAIAPPPSVTSRFVAIHDVALAAVYADHAHALNNARAALVAAIEIGEMSASGESLARDVDDAIARLAASWSQHGRALYTSSVGLVSAHRVSEALGAALGVSVGPQTDGHVRVDLTALEAAATVLCRDTTRATMVRSEQRRRGVFEMTAIRVGPLASATDSSESAVAAILKQLHIEIEVTTEPAAITFILVTAREKRLTQ